MQAERTLIAYSATTGRRVLGIPTADYMGTPVVSGGVVFVQGANQVQAFSATTGAPLWTSATMPGDVISTLTPAVDRGTVMVGTTRYLIAFSAATGQRIWTYDSGSTSHDFSEPAIANGVVYDASVGGGLQAFDEATGRVLYQGGSICWSAVVARGHVYAGCGDETIWSL